MINIISTLMQFLFFCLGFVVFCAVGVKEMNTYHNNCSLSAILNRFMIAFLSGLFTTLFSAMLVINIFAEKSREMTILNIAGIILTLILGMSLKMAISDDRKNEAEY